MQKTKKKHTLQKHIYQTWKWCNTINAVVSQSVTNHPTESQSHLFLHRLLSQWLDYYFVVSCPFISFLFRFSSCVISVTEVWTTYRRLVIVSPIISSEFVFIRNEWIHGEATTYTRPERFLTPSTSRHTLLPSFSLFLLSYSEKTLFSSHQPSRCEQAACNTASAASTRRSRWAWSPRCVLFHCFLCWPSRSCQWRTASC